MNASSEKHSAPLWDADLIGRYDVSGPRYTSYPTAPQFSAEFNSEALQAAITRSNASYKPLSLYYHLPFCDTLCYYCGCNKVVTHNKKRAQPYLQCLDQEMNLLAKQFDPKRTVKQLHWGGGTPTFINEAEMSWLMAATRRHFSLLDDDSGEYSVEIHPGHVTPKAMGHLRDIGFNRVSMGIQDFDPGVQKAVNRYNSHEEVRALVQALREQKFHSISMDLIYGLPLQTLSSVRDTLDKVIELSPDRLSLFNYAHMPHIFKSQRLINEKDLPAANEKLETLHMAIERLQEAGYIHIGMDHFSKPEDSLVHAQIQGKLQRNFQGYSTHGDCDLLSFGVSSISAFGGAFIQNEKQLTEYQKTVTSNRLPHVRGFVLSDEDKLRQAIINQIICHFHLDFSEIEKTFSVNFLDHFATELSELTAMQHDGLIDLDSQHLRVRPKGRLLVRRICMVFDAYLDTQRLISYSKVI